MFIHINLYEANNINNKVEVNGLVSSSSSSSDVMAVEEVMAKAVVATVRVEADMAAARVAQVATVAVAVLVVALDMAANVVALPEPTQTQATIDLSLDNIDSQTREPTGKI